jgi:hypothetical protein
MNEHQPLFDCLVGTAEHHRRNIEIERFCSLEVEDKLKLRGGSRNRPAKENRSAGQI